MLASGGLCSFEPGGVSVGVATSLGEGGFEIGGVGGGLVTGGLKLGGVGGGGATSLGEGGFEIGGVGVGGGKRGLKVVGVTLGSGAGCLHVFRVGLGIAAGTFKVEGLALGEFGPKALIGDDGLLLFKSAGDGAAGGVEREFELANEEIEACEFRGGVGWKLSFDAGGEDGGLGGEGIAGGGPVGEGRAREGRGVKRGEGLSVGRRIEVATGEGGGVFAERGAEFGVGEEALAGGGDFLGRAGFQEYSFAAVLHQQGEVGRREHDGFAGGEKLREF